MLVVSSRLLLKPVSCLETPIVLYLCHPPLYVQLLYPPVFIQGHLSVLNSDEGCRLKLYTELTGSDQVASL